MESSEDDAGAATNASRAVLAREKDVGASEDGGTSSGSTQETSEAGMAIETSSIPEEMFGPDSVPSPSAHDVNTSTEALLDMIDEIVEGPGAPKRLSLSSDHNETNDGIANTSDSNQDDGQSSSDILTVAAESLSPNLTVTLESDSKESISEILCPNETVSSEVNTPSSEPVHKVALESNRNAESLEESYSNFPQNNQSIPECRTTEQEPPESQQISACIPSTDSGESITPSANVLQHPKSEGESPLSSIPSSSVEEVKNESDISKNQVSERTIKCVSSSDNRDTVTVESAESTSSDNSIISESKSVVPDPATRSPLRRRLVRPVLVSVSCDRRPDSTVSSTADSQSVDVHTTEESSSEFIVKDVSSSDVSCSDAVSSASGSDKPEEIRNISEISVCKAETSTSPTKKIKLVRQKVSPITVPKDSTKIIPDRGLCQSTSSETVSTAPLPELSFSHSNLVNDTENVTKDTASSESIEPEPIPQPTDLPCASTEGSKNDTQQQHSVPSSEPQIDDSNKNPSVESNLTLDNITEIATCDKSNLESGNSCADVREFPQPVKQVPKLTIKLSGKPTEEIKSPIPKLTIKAIKPPKEAENYEKSSSFNIPSISKINIKPISRPAEKINDIHRKSSSSEISESESSENDEGNSTSDQASASDQSSVDVVPKVTIKLGKPGTESEGKFYTEQNAPKLTIKCQTDDQQEKVPKLTIKTIGKSEGQPLSPKLTKGQPLSPKLTKGQPLSPKLTIKPIKPPENESKDFSKELLVHTDGTHVPKITIKPVVKSDSDIAKTNKKSIVGDCPEHIPIVTKINIKPIVKPAAIGESSNSLEDKVPVVSKLNIKPIIKPIESSDSECADDFPVVSKLNIKPIVKPIDLGAPNTLDEVPVVSKLNIKPVLKPKDNDVDSRVEDVPKVTKLNIKPLRNPEEIQETKDCDVNAGIEKNSLPVVTKLNIKPIVKPTDEDTSKDSENQSSETGNSSDDNADHIPIVTKLNIKPIVKPNDSSETFKSNDCNVESIPVVTKLHIKPLIKPEEVNSPISPRRESLRSSDSKTTSVPTVTKLNIKPIVKPDEVEPQKVPEFDDTLKNPPLLMKINMKAMTEISAENKKVDVDTTCNNSMETVPIVSKLKIKPVVKHNEVDKSQISPGSSEKVTVNCKAGSSSSPAVEHPIFNCVPETKEKSVNAAQKIQNEIVNVVNVTSSEANVCVTNKSSAASRQQSTLQNCSLLKKLLEPKKDGLDNRLEEVKVNLAITALAGSSELNNISFDLDHKNEVNNIVSPELISCEEDLTKPLEINVSEKVTTQNSGQDSPRIILKINKTDHGPSAKIITEESQRPASPLKNDICKNTHEVNDTQKRNAVNSRQKTSSDSHSLPTGKRLRSSRIVEEKTPAGKRNLGKRLSSTETPVQTKDSELSVLETKRLKLGQLLSNKSMPITPVTSSTSEVFTAMANKETKQPEKNVNHALLNNENCSKNGNSKLHNILSNLQAKQAQALSFNDMNCSDKKMIVADIESNASTGSSDVLEIVPVNSHTEVREMIINENSESHDFNVSTYDLSQDPLDTSSSKPNMEVTIESPTIPIPEMTPQPKKRGRPRKLPVSEGAKPVVLPVPALEERPQRSLRLSRDRPAIIFKPRGRGRGRGAKRAESSLRDDTVDSPSKLFDDDDRQPDDIDPMSSRIKLPRMTEALDKMPSVCSTPLSSRRASDLDLKVVLDSIPLEEYKSPETPSGRGSRGRRARGRAAARTPARGSRGRGRGGGRGAVYMKETMGIYGRVCGPATTTVQLFEEETCMMDDNATPDKPSSHLLDEDSQSSVKSSTNESSKMKKSKFADLFDSNKVWTAADVKEYMWPPPETPNVEHQVMMIQEQVAMFLSVKSFKRRYPELKRRTIGGEERDYVLQKGLVSEALCDLGITAVDASEVLDIMLSDYPHKYEEYRSHQRIRQRREEEEKADVKVEKVEMKIEAKSETKPEPSKLDLEKSRQDMAAAAIASAMEFNSRVNSQRRGACVDLQSLTVLVRERPAPPAPAPAPAPRVRPAAGFYPHALLPGQYQHHYRPYTADELRYFPLNTVLGAPPPASPAASSSDEEEDWRSSPGSGDDLCDRLPKRKKLVKTKRSSQADPSSSTAPVKEEIEEELCKVCGLRIEANRKYTHERFLVCSTCNAKLHPGCVELSADTVRKCREYPWQCRACKSCGGCGLATTPATPATTPATPATTPATPATINCHLCDKAYHVHCLGLARVPDGRWHCAECSVCKSCGARDPTGPATSTSDGSSGPGSSGPGSSGPASGGTGSVSEAGGVQWHHHTKRGPGGHKIYSHSLCTPCARAYRIGRYCPLCDRSFIGPKGTMQLVICKLCDRQHHQECVRQMVLSLNVLDYTCAECRRGGITSRAAAARLAPRTIATLFMAKRRFNKYAHRQYMQSRVQPAETTPKPDDSVDATESGDPLADDVSDTSDQAPDEDPLDGAGETIDQPQDEAAAAVQALRMDFGD